MAAIAKKQKLIWILTILLITGFLATSLASYFVSKESIRQEIMSYELPLTGDTVYSEIRNDFIKPVFISSMMANDTFLRDWVLGGEQDSKEITRYLKEIKDKYDAVTSFFVSEKSRTYYHADGVLKTINKEDPRDAWYFRVRSMTQDHEINVDPDLGNNDAMTIFINHRVYDYDGHFIGATGVGLTVTAVKSLIETYQRKYNRSIYFVDQDGVVVMSGQGANHGKKITEMEGLAEISGGVLGGAEGSFSYEKAGQTVLLLTRAVPELNWHLFVEQVEDDATAHLRRTLLANLGVCLVITLIVVLLTNYVVTLYQERLETMATTDNLTGLKNRHAFEFICEQALSEVDRSRIPVSAVIIDIDRFKKVNDRYGHLTGDRVIRRVGHCARANLRAADVLCRWGGEEYLVLLKDCALKDAYAIAEKVRKAVEAEVVSDGDHDLSVTVSVGVAQYRAGESRDALISRADKALFVAKKGGRNRTALDE